MKSLLIESLRKQKAARVGQDCNGSNRPSGGLQSRAIEKKRVDEILVVDERVRSLEHELSNKDDTIDFLKKEVAQRDGYISDLEEKTAFLTDYGNHLEKENFNLKEEIEQLKKKLDLLNGVNSALSAELRNNQDNDGVGRFY